MSPPNPTFLATAPAVAAAQLDDGSVHLWRIPYRPEQRRAPLLALLGDYLGVPAEDVSVLTAPGGKPRLTGSAAARGARSRLDFNWSHSGDFALIALARDLALGVDIEHLAKRPRALEIAERYFDPGEAEALAAFGEADRKRAFIALWCAKESVLKAQGTGLSFGLERLAFRLDGQGLWQLARIDPALGSTGEWQIAGFEAAPEYRGALAWRGTPRPLHAFQPPTEHGQD
ncbi:MAG TPA: 4'-phosphopantetheinyl transferase superfamily protein [Rhodanobacteraceae bacterium]|jgi:4'-phosphopantetheinyl transferase|nr:4'-phosphopantetheinyl transferase superfamily protein [Rhodanobacteraceae bacterium]